MSAPKATWRAGLFLIGWGVGFYLAADPKSVTALIPAFFGAVLVVLGLLGGKDKLRMHVMHAAALLALIGLGMGIWRVTKAEIGSLAFYGVAGMALISGLLLVVHVRSFQAARKARAA